MIHLAGTVTHRVPLQGQAIRPCQPCTPRPHGGFLGDDDDTKRLYRPCPRARGRSHTSTAPKFISSAARRPFPIHGGEVDRHEGLRPPGLRAEQWEEGRDGGGEAGPSSVPLLKHIVTNDWF